MKHLIISREFPPAPGGGIGTYVMHISKLLAQHGEEVHVIGALWKGGESSVEELENGRLIVHRVPLRDWKTKGIKRHPSIESPVTRSLFDSGFNPMAFSWQASLLAEQLVEQHGIDLIEAQEFEAPLYFLQLRRALGTGPTRKPPCIIHLHSPMEFIVRYNDWDIYEPYFQLAKRTEDYTIRAADRLLCPSRYLARQAEAHYGLGSGNVETIPLPIGDSVRLDRMASTWRNGTVCFAGRLERRKGIIEWIDAAVAVAEENEDVRFEMVGPSTPGATRNFLQERIPEPLRSRFVFRGNQPRAEMRRILAQARVAVVPSRWENFPYVCLEAMASGLPVIASSSGGMAEMLTDGRNGWLAPKCDADALASALRRAIDTSPDGLALMGRAAAEDVRRLCEPQKVLEAHLRFRSRAVEAGPGRSLVLPDHSNPRGGDNGVARRGVAIVVAGNGAARDLSLSLASVASQKAQPVAVALSENEATRNTVVMRELGSLAPHIVAGEPAGPAFKSAAVELVLESGANPDGFAFLDANDQLLPEFVETCERALARDPDLGIVSFWCWQPEGRRLWARLSPCFPYQWLFNEACPMSVIRTEALLAAGKFRTDAAGHEFWDLVNAILAAGWKAVTVPAPLGILGDKLPDGPRVTLDDEQRRLRTALFARFPEIVTRQAAEIVALAQSIASSRAKEDFAAWNRWKNGRKLLARGRRLLSRVKRSLMEVLEKNYR